MKGESCMWAPGPDGKREHSPTCCCSLWGLSGSWPLEAGMRCSAPHSCWRERASFPSLRQRSLSCERGQSLPQEAPAAFTAVVAAPSAASLWRDSRGQSDLTLKKPVKTSPAVGQDTFRLGNPWPSLETWTSSVLLWLPISVTYWPAFSHPDGLPRSGVGILRDSRGGLDRFPTSDLKPEGP